MKGQRPSAADAFWRNAAERLNVEESLQRVESHAKYLLGLYTVVAVLLAGTGVITGATYDGADMRWIALCTIPVAISFALAVAAITPGPATLNPGDLESVRKHYTKLIASRGRLIFASSVFFALSLLLTIPAFLNIYEDPPKKRAIAAKPTVTIAKAEDGYTMSVKADLAGLPSGARVTVLAVETGAVPRQLLGHESVSLEDGAVVMEADVPLGAVTGPITVTIHVTTTSGSLYSETLTVAPPAVSADSKES